MLRHRSIFLCIHRTRFQDDVHIPLAVRWSVARLILVMTQISPTVRWLRLRSATSWSAWANPFVVRQPCKSFIIFSPTPHQFISLIPIQTNLYFLLHNLRGHGLAVAALSGLFKARLHCPKPEDTTMTILLSDPRSQDTGCDGSGRLVNKYELPVLCPLLAEFADK
jgi:hypothetical protein